MKKMIWIRENEVECVYQCGDCKKFRLVPKGCDIPSCTCKAEMCIKNCGRATFNESKICDVCKKELEQDGNKNV